MPSTPFAVLLVVVISTGCARTDPTPSPTPVPDAAELVATGEALEPGRYTRTGFEPPITIELDPGWQAVQMGDGFFDVQQRVGTADVIAVQFARPSAMFGEDGAAEAETPEAAVEALRANPGLAVIETGESRIGGMDGAQVTVENTGEARASIMMVPLGPLGIDPGRRLWIAFFDEPDGLLAIMVGGSTATWDEALVTAEPVLESVRVGQ